jgi:hypothetical protein
VDKMLIYGKGLKMLQSNKGKGSRLTILRFFLNFRQLLPPKSVATN